MDNWSISFLKRRGSSSSAPTPIVDIQIGSYTNSTTDPVNAAASISFNPSGLLSVFATTGSGYTWLVDGIASDYSIFLHKLSGGTLEGIAEEVWVNLGSIQTFGVSQTTDGTKNWDGEMSIRKDSPATVFETVGIAFSATRSPAEGGGGGGGAGGGGGVNPN